MCVAGPIYLESQTIPQQAEQLSLELQRTPFHVVDKSGATQSRHADMGDAQDVARELGAGHSIYRCDDSGALALLVSRIAPRGATERMALQYAANKLESSSR